jgi:hypothetical protein
MKNKAAKSLIGCCGLYCGLCSKYQSKAPSRCLGCKLGEQHSWCSIWNCCVKKHGLESCAECGEVFHCELLIRRKVAEWIPAAANLRRIKRVGTGKWLQEQIEREQLVKELLGKYNEGRSMSFYCKACARMPVASMKRAIRISEKRIASQRLSKSDMKLKAKIVRAAIEERRNVLEA